MTHWVTSWAGSAQGPYPIGNPSAQPDLRFALPDQAARDQTFRLNVQPSFWGEQARIRLSNAHGTQPVTFDGVHVGLQQSGSVIEPGTNRPVTFGGRAAVTIVPGEWVWSDPVAVDRASICRRLAVSLPVVGDSGAMTWHAKALTTSYLTAPGAGAWGASDGVLGFPYSTTSWFFLDAVDMAAPAETRLIVAFGDSITDGTGTTLNGDDRWPDVLLQRLRAKGIGDVAISNAGIGGNQVVGPADDAQPFRGGPPALDRMERDLLALSGVTHVVWLEGTNDFSASGNASAEAVIDGMARGVARIRARLPGVRVIGATLVTALGSSNAGHGDAGQDAKRKALNSFIRDGGLFDGVADFDRATVDPATGQMRPEFVPDSTIGGPGDGLHPNRAGYQAMAGAIDLDVLLG
jgi:lysophospholipase L1-like esterase